jgi:hypothetical protein
MRSLRASTWKQTDPSPSAPDNSHIAAVAAMDNLKRQYEQWRTHSQQWITEVFSKTCQQSNLQMRRYLDRASMTLDAIIRELLHLEYR